MFFSQSSEIELLIRNVTEQHDDVYACIAQNIAGSAESTTNVTVICITNHNINDLFLVFIFLCIYYTLIHSVETWDT